MKMSELPGIERHIKLSNLGEFAERLSVMTNELRDQILAPRPRKTPRLSPSANCRTYAALIARRLITWQQRKGGELPPGEAHGTGRARIFSLKDARTWVQQVSDIYQTPLVTGTRDHRGRVLITANFKGGSCKTTTTMCIAQGLSLRGRRVLVIDLDPQASLSELCGLYAEKDVTWKTPCFRSSTTPRLKAAWARRCRARIGTVST